MLTHGYLLPTRNVVLSSDDQTEQTAKTNADVLGLAHRAEALGFDSLWVGDSVLAKPRHEPMTILSAVAEATDSVMLGTAVHLPTLRHPVHTAHQGATLDQISGGRFAFGVGVGIGDGVEREYDQLDVSYDRRGPILDEALDVITDLWENRTVTRDGEFFSLDEVRMELLPCRPPPVYIASTAFDPAKGFPKRIERRIGNYAKGWIPAAMSPDRYEVGIEKVREFVAEGGRNPDTVDAAYYQDVVIADSEEAAFEEAKDFLRTYYPKWDLSNNDIRQRGVFGPPDLVRDHMERYANAGVETLVTRFTAKNQREQLQRFGRLI